MAPPVANVSARKVVPESAVYAGPPTLIRVGSVADVEVVPATSFDEPRTGRRRRRR